MQQQEGLDRLACHSFIHFVTCSAAMLWGIVIIVKIVAIIAVLVMMISVAAIVIVGLH